MKYLALFVLLIASAHTAGSEADYVNAHCQGVIEYRLPDRTRVDCLMLDHAIEYDYGKKWAEAIGQALHYAIMTGKRGGIVLIGDDKRYTNRATNIIQVYSLPIDLWIISE